MAGKLLHQVVEMAREQNKKITPTCSYAKQKLQDTKEYHDVLS
ncbi:N-acetyltransferase [Priestia filamentosa]